MALDKRVHLAPPADLVLNARAVMGAIDFDPYSTPDINRLVTATHFHDRDRGDFYALLHDDWKLPGDQRVLVSPAFSAKTSRPLINKTLREYRCGRVREAILWLPHNETIIRAPWLWDFPACIPFQRLRPCWWDEEVEMFRTVDPTDWSAIFYLPPATPPNLFHTKVARFHSAFSPMGRIVINELGGEGDWEDSYKVVMKRSYNYRE